MNITGKIEIDILHRQNLGVPAARRTTFEAEAGTQARLTQAYRCLLPNPIESIPKTHRGRRLAFSCRGGRLRSD